jgi:hypothetical protein
MIRAAQALSTAMKDAAGTDLARVVTVCCAADAQLARIHGRAALSLGGKSTADAGDATTAGV